MKKHTAKRSLNIILCALMLAEFSGCADNPVNTDTSPADNTDNANISEAAAAENTSALSSLSDVTVSTVNSEETHSDIFGTSGEISAYDKANSNYSLSADAGNSVHEISDELFGVFFEDINFAADGGLYAEMIQNRSFEFTGLASGNERHAWTDIGDISAEVRSGDGIVNESADYFPLNENNPNYMVLENNSDTRAGIANKGFLDGMAVKENSFYDVSAYTRKR